MAPHPGRPETAVGEITGVADPRPAALGRVHRQSGWPRRTPTIWRRCGTYTSNWTRASAKPAPWSRRSGSTACPLMDRAPLAGGAF